MTLAEIRRIVAERELNKPAVMNDAFDELAEHITTQGIVDLVRKCPALRRELAGIVARWPMLDDAVDMEWAEHCAEEQLRKGYMG